MLRRLFSHTHPSDVPFSPPPPSNKEQSFGWGSMAYLQISGSPLIAPRFLITNRLSFDFLSLSLFHSSFIFKIFTIRDLTAMI